MIFSVLFTCVEKKAVQFDYRVVMLSMVDS